MNFRRRGGGESVTIGVAPSSQEISTRRLEEKISIDDLITHTMPQDKIDDAFELMREGKSIRSEIVH